MGMTRCHGARRRGAIMAKAAGFSHRLALLSDVCSLKPQRYNECIDSVVTVVENGGN
jgi:hypothetical protein